MKLSQFRQIIKEEVKRVLKEAQGSIDVVSYFKNYGVSMTPSFDLKKLATTHKMPEKVVATLLVNLEDDNIMRDIAKGKYDTFNPFDSSQFNDEYETVTRMVKLYNYMGDDAETVNIKKFIQFLKSKGLTMLTSLNNYSKFNDSEVDMMTFDSGSKKAEKNFNLIKQNQSEISKFLRGIIKPNKKITVGLFKSQFGDVNLQVSTITPEPGEYVDTVTL
jgi:hypothetical protein